MAAKISAKQGVFCKIAIGVFAGQFCFPTGLAVAEQGLTANFRFSQNIDSIHEKGFTTRQNEGVRAVTNLGFGIVSQTRNQVLSFDLSTGLISRFSGGSDFETQRPTARLSYAIENRNMAFNVDGVYRRSSIDESVFLDEETGRIIAGAGRLENLTVNSSLDWGRDAPLSGNITHSYGRAVYSGTLDPDLLDNSTQSLNAKLVFEINPVLSVNAFTNWRETDEYGTGAIDRETRSIGVGANYAISPTTSVSGNVSRVTNETRGATNKTSNTGIGYSLGVVHERTNGQINLKFSEDQTTIGKRRQMSIGRNFDWKRGSISLTFGLAKTDGYKLQHLANASINYELDRVSAIQLSLSQNANVNRNDIETISTRLSVNYNRELNQVSSLNAGLQLVSQDILGPDQDDLTSIRFNFQHRYQVGAEWDLVSGYEYTSVRRESLQDRDTNRFFVGIQKTFSFRP